MSHKVLEISGFNFPRSISGLKFFNLQGGKCLLLWDRERAYFCNATILPEKNIVCFGISNLPHGIKDVIFVERSVLFLVENGVIYTLDLNEDSARSKEHVLICKEFNFTVDVSAMAKTSDGFLILRKTGEIMVFHLIYIETGESKILHKMTNTIPYYIFSEISFRSTYMIVYRSSSFVINLASLLFGETALLDCDILLIALESGNVYWVPILSNMMEQDFKLFHFSSSYVKGIVCSLDTKQNKYNKMMIISSNGSVTIMSCHLQETELKSHICYFPGSIKSCCLVQEKAIYHSDSLNLWCSTMVDKETENISFVTQLLPIKGVVGIVTGTGERYALVVCRHAIVYHVDYLSECDIKSSERQQGTVEHDSRSIVLELQCATNELASVQEILVTENKALQEISIAARGSVLKDMIHLKVEVDDSFPHSNKLTLHVKVLNKSLQEFSKEFWSFHSYVKVGERSINVVEKLEGSFKSNTSLIFLIPIEGHTLTFPTAIDCSIVLGVPLSNNSGKHQLLDIPIKRCLLDVTYFFSPVSDENLIDNKESQSDKEECWKQLLARFQESSSHHHPPKSKASNHLHCYSFKLPVTKSWSTFIEAVVRNSEHRFHHKFKDSQMMKFRVKYSIVIFMYNNEKHVVDLISSNKEIIGEIKDYIVSTFFSVNELMNDKTVSINLDDNTLLKLQNLKLIFELKTETTAENLNCLKREMRELVNMYLPM